MYCIHCGKDLPNTAKFCDRCGKAVQQEKSTYSYAYRKATTNTPKSTPVSTAASNSFAGSSKPDDTPQEPIVHTAIPKKSGNMGCLSWILILVALYCIYTWFLKPMWQEKDPIEDKEPTTSAAAQTQSQSREEQQAEILADRLPGIQEEFRDLPIFQNRLGGNCKTLEGDVAITVLFMDDWESSWTQEKKDEFLSAVYDTCWDLTYEAANWGKEVNFTVFSTQGYAEEIVEPQLAYLSFPQHVASAGYSNYMPDFVDALQAQTYTEKVPVIVAFNKTGRSYACPDANDYDTVEKCYIFDDTSALKHELLHLFGAADFYYHDYLDWSVGEYLGDSIMASSSEAFSPVDDMTAYLIGWTDTLTDNASSFVYAAGAVGTDAMTDAQQQNSLSGYATITLDDGAVYTGTLSMGVPDGTGEIQWPNGNHYSGEWNHGQMVCGTYTWADGTVYVGQFQDGDLHGQGIITYSNGQVQSGYWEYGEFIG